VNYILGLAGQYAAGVGVLRTRTDRWAFLCGVAEQRERLDPLTFPFMRSLFAGFDQHDEQVQFLAGIDVMLAGATPREVITAHTCSRSAAQRTARALPQWLADGESSTP